MCKGLKPGLTVQSKGLQSQLIFGMQGPLAAHLQNEIKSNTLGLVKVNSVKEFF